VNTAINIAVINDRGRYGFGRIDGMAKLSTYKITKILLEIEGSFFLR
jgi:hypothetical protein